MVTTSLLQNHCTHAKVNGNVGACLGGKHDKHGGGIPLGF
jgi:hypothetical protein